MMNGKHARRARHAAVEVRCEGQGQPWHRLLDVCPALATMGASGNASASAAHGRETVDRQFLRYCIMRGYIEPVAAPHPKAAVALRLDHQHCQETPGAHVLSLAGAPLDTQAPPQLRRLSWGTAATGRSMTNMTRRRGGSEPGTG